MMRDGLWYKCKPKLIPDISDADVEAMIAQIRPVVMVEEGRFREIVTDGVDRRMVAFTWQPKLGRAVQIYRGGLNDVSILTFHTRSFYGFFKPALAEVYACIRMFVPDWTAVRYFWLNSKEMDSRNIIGDYHWCPCILFGGEETEVIDPEWKAFAASCTTAATATGK